MDIQTGLFTIYLGDAKTLSLKLIYEGSLNPFDLTDCTEIDITLPNSDGTFTHYLLSAAEVVIASPAVLGQFSCAIPSADSLLLNVGELQTFDVTFTVDSKPFTQAYPQALSVKQRN